MKNNEVSLFHKMNLRFEPSPFVTYISKMLISLFLRVDHTPFLIQPYVGKKILNFDILLLSIEFQIIIDRIIHFSISSECIYDFFFL